MERIDCDVAVVGGGLAGLACGVALSDRGLRVVVLERDAQVGGRARSWVHAPTGDVVDIGPHVVHTEYRNFPALLDRLGTRDRIVWHDDKLLTLATQPRPTELRHHALSPPFSLLPDFMRLPGIALRDMLSNSAATWGALRFDERDVAQLDSIPALDYLRAKGATPAMIDTFWRFASMVVMNTPLERVSTAALLRVHSQLIGHRRLHFGFACVGLGELYEPGAVAAIEGKGGRVLIRTQAMRVEDGDNPSVIAEGLRVNARHCVLALPPAELDRLRPGLAANDFEPSPYVSVYLWFDRKITRERFWALPWKPGRRNYDYYDLSNIRDGWRERPSITASNIIHSHESEALDDDAIVAETVREMTEFIPDAAQAQVVHASVHRIPMAIACPLAGSESKRPVTKTSLPRVFLAGDWTRTGMPSSMESATCSGFLAAEAVLADLGRPESLALPTRPNDGLAGLVQRLG